MPRSKAARPQVVSFRDLPGVLEAAEGFPALVEGLAKGQAGTVDGAWNSAASLSAATLALRAPKTLLVVLAHPRDVDLWIEDLYTFSGLRSVTFPAWDSLPTGDTVLDEVGGQRLRVLRQLDSHTPPKLL